LAKQVLHKFEDKLHGSHLSDFFELGHIQYHLFYSR